jgi:hypothetical protein
MIPAEHCRKTPMPSRSATERPGHRELACFSLFLLAYLIPVWAFPFIPTQDGPSHLSNALILKDYGAPGIRYHEFFELHFDAFPNWTSHLALAALMYLFPPLVAEKVLVSVYVLGFGWSYRYFLGALDRAARSLAPAGLLFLFSFCFMKGFYNFCLSLILFWLVLGYCIRRGPCFRWRDAAVVGLFLVAGFFTHLVGCLLAAVGAVWVLTPALWKTLRRFGWLAGAILPVLFLTLRYFAKSGITLHESTAQVEGALSRILDPATLESRLSFLPDVFFQGTGEWADLMAGLAALFYVGLVLTIPPRSAKAVGPAQARSSLTTYRLPVGLFGLVMAVLYFALPNHWGQHGGHIISRVALLAPLLWLACCPISPKKSRQWLLQAALCLLLAVQLFFVTMHFRDGNRVIQQFTAAVNQIGGGRIIFVTTPPRLPEGVSLVEHGACYYALTKGNVNLDNYEAELPYFPVRFREGIVRGRGDLSHYPGREAVDLVFVWEDGLTPNANSDRPLPLVSRCGPLAILANRDPP